ncbi:MAG: 50S ribosomal protein L4 [Planctomycetes bacterium]|nr:50S ribosomal protein L4 [Planctomycetota bacterium]
MVDVKVYDAEGKEKESISFDETVFGDKVKSRTLREVVLAAQANQRQGNANSKNLSDVSGSGKKPWTQKGTGRARQGQKRAPHRKKGSVAHGPHPRSYATRVPVKMRRLALQSAFLSAFRDGKISVVDGLSFEQPKTRSFAKMLEAAGMAKGTLLMGLNEADRNLYLSGRNIQGMTIKTVKEFGALDVMRTRRILLTPEALESLKGGIVIGKAKAGATQPEAGSEK